MSSNGLSCGLRWSSGVGVGAVVIDGVLLSTRMIDWRTALILLLAVEVPLLLLAVSLHVVTYRRARQHGASGAHAWDELVLANPPLRLIQVELGRLLGFVRDGMIVLRGRQYGSDAFAATAGTRALPVVLVGVVIVETTVAHLLLPWAWLRLVLLAAAAYTLLLVAAFWLAREAHPHRIATDPTGRRSVHLMFGRHLVADLDVDQVVEARRVSTHQHTWLVVDDGATGDADGDATAYLANQSGTNVRLTLSRPMHYCWPLLQRLRHEK